MQQLISLLVENKPGALLRVAGLLTARGYNIESLTVAKTLDPTLSNMTIVAGSGISAGPRSASKTPCAYCSRYGASRRIWPKPLPRPLRRPIPWRRGIGGSSMRPLLR